jgi:glycosyltransferase involved in cell wall biosynthesis
VTLEALASGLPAVVANATGSNALVENGVNGFLATPRNSPEFAEKVELLLDDHELRARMGAKARSRAEHYDWSRVLAQIVSYYEEVH